MNALLGWRLWRALCTPSMHVIATHSAKARPPQRWAVFFRNFMLVLFVTGVLVNLLQLPVSPFLLSLRYDNSLFNVIRILSIIGWIGVGIAVVVYFTGGIFAGVSWGASIAFAIADQRTRQTLDLLMLTPEGKFGAFWHIAQGKLRANGVFTQQRRRHLWSFLLMYGLLAYQQWSLFSSLGNGTIEIAEVLSITVPLSIVALFVSIDFRWSIVIGVLVGMLAPAVARKRADSQIIASSIAIGVHVATYILFFYMLFNLGTNVRGLSFEASALVFGSLVLLYILAAREFAVRFLWSEIISRLETTRASTDVIISASRNG
jgi:uncharacterized membrane protein YeaQ/YmgE (transglycosylase-associated protein family)